VKKLSLKKKLSFKKQKKGDGWKIIRKRDLFPYLLNVPMIVYMLGVLAFAMIWGIALSFTDKKIAADPNFIGLENYITLLKSPDYINSIKITLKYTVFCIAGKLFFGTAMALTLNEPFRGKNLVRALLLLPWTIPMIVVALNWRWIFAGTGGALNYILRSVGIIERNLNFLGAPALAFMCIVISDVWRGTPFFGNSILARLQTIPKVYYEASKIDGANAIQRFIYITLPNIKNTMLVTTLVSTIWTLNAFGFIWNLTGGGPNHTTELMNVYSYITAMSNRKLGLGLAVSIMAMPFLLILIEIITGQNLKTIDE